MLIIHGFRKIKKFKKPVVVLGVFDGVHRGHRIILENAARKARQIKGTSIVLTFSPHPQKENRLYSLKHRLRLIADIGIDVCVVINFNQKFAAISAEDFVKGILFKRLGADYVFVGKNFRFGRRIEGDTEILRRLAKKYNFKTKVFAVAKINNRPISSTYIRRFIKKGKLVEAQKLLGRPVSVLGTVIKGNSLASKLGFPTANINPHHEVIPPSGVYAVKVFLDNKKLKGICNIGTRPTFMSTGEKHIEAYIFNFKQDIYGKYLEIQFAKKIRNEKKFASSAALSSQIKKDIITAKKLLSLP